MTNIKRKWDLLSKERKESLVKEIIAYFKMERDEDIGIISAEDVLDFFLQTAGSEIYNKAIEDSKATLKKDFEDLEIDLDLLMNK